MNFDNTVHESNFDDLLHNPNFPPQFDQLELDVSFLSVSWKDH